MFRPVFALPFLALVLVIVIGLPGSGSLTGFGPAPAAAGAHDTVMRCMEKCIREEGKADKANCKTRCAPVPSVFGRSQGGGRQPDSGSCMSGYKDCMQGCAKGNKICKRVCKKALMRCQ